MGANHDRRILALSAWVASVGAVALSASDARADSIIKNPGDHPRYSVELEPHGLLGWANLYRDNGLGLGARFTIPIVENGFVKTINNSVGIGFGLDWLRYDGCYYYGASSKNRVDYGCGASFFVFPVVMQWNFWLTPRWSVFGEPGLYVFHGVYDDYCNGVPGCGYPTRTSVQPALYLGGRFHFNDKISLTMRVGYPTLSIGASFFL
jgi:hypothetical protein